MFMVLGDTPKKFDTYSLFSQIDKIGNNANLTCACKTETLGSLYSHSVLIPLKSSKSKYQVVHEQKFKDLLSSTCQVSHWIFLCSKASNANTGIIANFV